MGASLACSASMRVVDRKYIDRYTKGISTVKSIFQKSCSPEETSSLMCMDQTVHIQHDESGSYDKCEEGSCRRASKKIWHEWSVEPLTLLESEVASESKIEDLLNGQQPEPEEEGETRVRVAISSKRWFEVETRLNGQRH